MYKEQNRMWRVRINQILLLNLHSVSKRHIEDLNQSPNHK